MKKFELQTFEFLCLFFSVKPVDLIMAAGPVAPPTPAEHQWLVTSNNTAGPRLTEATPELKSWLLWKRGLAAHNAASPLNFCLCLDGWDKCCEMKMRGASEEKEQQSDILSAVRFMKQTHI